MAFDLQNYLADLRQQVDTKLAELLPPVLDPDPIRMREAIRKAVLAGGKRLRPCVAIASCQAVGGTIEQALAPACALEMVHAYSLVHDDLPAMDDEDLRRGQPTCHKAFGEATAVLVGDAALTHAFEVLSREGIRRPEACSALLRATFELAHGAGVYGMVGGQAIDIALQEAGAQEKEPDFDHLEACHAKKTAALFTAAATIGGLVGGGSEKQVDLLRSYGFDLGMAFQHADDLLDHDFPAFSELSLKRADELSSRAVETARQFGDAGQPLVALAELVRQRAKEAT